MVSRMPVKSRSGSPNAPGAGYENVEVETKDGRSVSGRMVENTETRVRLLSAGPKEDIIAQSDIAVHLIDQSVGRIEAFLTPQTLLKRDAQGLPVEVAREVEEEGLDPAMWPFL